MHFGKKILIALSVCVLPSFALAVNWGCTGTDGSAGSPVYSICMHYCTNQYLNQFKQCQNNQINNVTINNDGGVLGIPSCIAYDNVQGYDVTVSNNGCPCIKGQDNPCH